MHIALKGLLNGAALAVILVVFEYMAIQREVRLMQKVKPVVVSMGTVAASGGYWISTYSDRIFAEPTTITASSVPPKIASAPPSKSASSA